MRIFGGVEGWVRKHFLIYRIARSAAPFICRFITLEEGFEILKFVSPVNSNLTALDIGANDGTSIRMIRQFQKQVNIVAFDPLTKPKFDLSNVDFREYALSNSANSFSLFTPVVHGVALTQYSSFHSDKLRKQIEHDLGIERADYGIIEKTVQTRTLDSLNLSPFFIKIDVEGSERDVLEGSLETIKKYLPIILVEIQNLETYSLISSLLSQNGYVSISLDPSKNVCLEKISLNYQSQYLSSRNNYVWIPRQKSPTWAFGQ
jgi:FkbM family methyltransferase